MRSGNDNLPNISGRFRRLHRYRHKAGSVLFSLLSMIESEVAYDAACKVAVDLLGTSTKICPNTQYGSLDESSLRDVLRIAEPLLRLSACELIY